MSRVIALVALFALVAAVSAGPWASCGTSSDHFKISSVNISPASLSPGQQFSIAVAGSLDEQITGGNAQITVKYLGVPVYSHVFDVCDLAKQGGYSCPLAAGPVSISKTETFPNGVPRGTYKGELKITDQNGQEVACVDFQMPVSAPSPTDPVLDDKIIAEVNAANAGWVAHRSPRFEGMTIAEARKLLKMKYIKVQDLPSVSLQATVPTSFDARTQWPTCIHPIRDQQQCGSCWAFSATEALTDRFCIASKGSINVVLSPQWLVSCDTSSYGCDGGYLDTTWEYFESTGVTSDACTPYTSGGGDSGTCPSTCSDGSALKFYKVQSGTSVHLPDVASMQTSIMTQGPIQVAFEVYQDFMSYKSGIYRHVSGSLLGGHAVKVVGWGVQNNQAYWIIANSWNTNWGMQGFFWIARGTNECGIESSAYAGLPLLQ